MIYQYLCKGKCKREFEEQRSYENRNSVSCCGVIALKLICTEPYIVNETRDYNFTAKPGRFGKQGVEVRGRSHYKQLLKENDLADCSLKEAISVKPKVDNGYKRKQVVRNTMKKITQEGLAPHVKGFMRDVVKMKTK